MPVNEKDSPNPDAMLGGPRRGRNDEHRFPAVVAVLVGVVLYAALPSNLTFGTRFVVPALEIVLLVPLVAINPHHFNRETKWSRAVSVALVAVIGCANTVSLVLLVHALVSGAASDAKKLLLAALQVWLTNIIVFGLAYWELDRGGPVKRTQLSRSDLPLADFRFSQDENGDSIDEVAAASSEKSDWAPRLVDYLYVSVTNSTAFSPTDTMPLSTRAKLLMSVQCMSALIVSVLVIAKAVSGLK
ncbi:MAG: hypothetical protein QOF81_994 [Acidimicrobiaceae bacterium]|nr:hypothetical protein [Acidimicrobiaceae bacterium]MDQ1415381.1 hypothetical protein [Acidimicrobiaceae bacterium]